MNSRGIPVRETRQYDTIPIHTPNVAFSFPPSPFLVISHPFRVDNTTDKEWTTTRQPHVWCLPLPYVVAGIPLWTYVPNPDGNSYVYNSSWKPTLSIAGQPYPLIRVLFGRKVSRVGAPLVRSFEGAPLPGDIISAQMGFDQSGYVISPGRIRATVNGTINADGRISTGSTSVPHELLHLSVSEGDAAVAWFEPKTLKYRSVSAQCPATA